MVGVTVDEQLMSSQQVQRIGGQRWNEINNVSNMYKKK